jgi:hypothetical protein
MHTYSGSCHCGNIKFSVTTDPIELTTCDCSLCVKKNAVMLKVHESEFTLHTSADLISTYQWNTQIAKHHFCSRCGIYTFHRKRAQPNHYGINVFCLNDFDYKKIPQRATEGASMSLECSDPQPHWPGPHS